MGTDIHTYAEVKVNGQWQPAKVDVPDDRNYWAFALLAGVRNGVGFGGCDLGNAVTPIAEPRGIPSDTSYKEEKDAEGYTENWLGDHSHSWVTLAELLALNLDLPITERGMVSPESARAFKETNTPPPASGAAGQVAPIGCRLNGSAQSVNALGSSLKSLTRSSRLANRKTCA